MAERFAHHGTAPEPLRIRDFLVKSAIFGWLFATEVQMRKANNGKLFLDLTLRDQLGHEITGRYFDPPGNEALLPRESTVVLLEGIVEKFNNQVYIRLSQAMTDETAPSELFLPATRHPLAQLERNLQQLIDKVYHPDLHDLLESCFTPEVVARFRRWPAAVRHHGTAIGGLLEHTVQVALIADRMTQMYPCNADLVLAGALLHDIGKLEELEEQVGSGFTPDGRMFGHIVRGLQYVQERAQQISTLDMATRNDLLHIILAHHTREYGSPVSPVSIEALIVHLADKAEASLSGFIEHCERTTGPDGWSSYSAKYGGQLRMPAL
ncbi:MAG TPA: HD domain-containing protein [Ktedonobacteraceae bacterium]|nr:HD domain-containing protein [Ktedonobacteraceae bacterium]